MLLSFYLSLSLSAFSITQHMYRGTLQAALPITPFCLMLISADDLLCSIQAENLFLRLIDTSLQAFAPRVMEVLHRVRVAGR